MAETEQKPPVSTSPPSLLQQVGGWIDAQRQAFQARMPEWARQHSSTITQIGLMTFTGVMLGSVLRGKQISRDIFHAQKDALAKTGLQGAALEQKVGELIGQKVMAKPQLHRQRMFYLPTAVGSFAIGAFIKDKTTPEEQKSYDAMRLPEYMATRVKEGFDPLHHSRQTSGLVGATSGVLAIISALSQPGGVHKSEAVVGATLISGFTALTFIKDPTVAKQMFSVCWWLRAPVVVSGTYESLLTHPHYKHPLTGAKLHLPGKRMDVSYPVGQWGNMACAAFGFLMAGSDTKKPATQVSTVENATRLVPADSKQRA